MIGLTGREPRGLIIPIVSIPAVFNISFSKSVYFSTVSSVRWIPILAAPSINAPDGEYWGFKPSGFGKLEAQRNVWDGIWTREEATSFLKKYSFVDSAMNSADFEQLSEDAGHFTSHDYSCEVVREYLEAKCGTVKGKWDMLTKMFQVPISMKGIADKTFDPRTDKCNRNGRCIVSAG